MSLGGGGDFRRIAAASAWFARRRASTGGGRRRGVRRGGEIGVYDGAGGREAICSADGPQRVRRRTVPRAPRVTGGCAGRTSASRRARAVVRGGGGRPGERGRGEGRGDAEGDTGGGGGTLLGVGGTTRRMARRRSSRRRARARGSLGASAKIRSKRCTPALSGGRGGAPVAPWRRWAPSSRTASGDLACRPTQRRSRPQLQISTEVG